jgi:GT2 family glycosyltransferase
MDLSVIIINYKSAHHVINCIESIYKETVSIIFEIIVVDNDSADRSEKKIKEKFPNVIWIQTGYNAGFARANNAGIRQAQGDYILILNADTIILENALAKAVALHRKTPEAAAIGVQLLNPDGSHQISGAHFVKGGLNFLLPLPYLGRIVRWLGYQLKSRVPSITEVSGKIEVDWIVGAFILVRKKVLPHSGLMEDDFFMYAEEIEWCSRLKKQGKLYLFDEPKVIHLGGGTSSEYYVTNEHENSKNLWNKKGRQIMVSQFLRIRKQFGIIWFIIILIIFVIEIPIFIIGLFIEKMSSQQQAKYEWDDVSGYIANIGVALKLFPKIIANRPHFYKVY